MLGKAKARPADQKLDGQAPAHQDPGGITNRIRPQEAMSQWHHPKKSPAGGHNPFPLVKLGVLNGKSKMRVTKKSCWPIIGKKQTEHSKK